MIELRLLKVEHLKLTGGGCVSVRGHYGSVELGKILRVGARSHNQMPFKRAGFELKNAVIKFSNEAPITFLLWPIHVVSNFQF